MVCSNDKCAYNQNLHKQCYDALEISLIRTIQSSMGRTRDWTDEQCRKAMWNRVYDLIYRHCKCFCGGHLKKFEDAVGEVAAAGNNAEANNEVSSLRTTVAFFHQTFVFSSENFEVLIKKKKQFFSEVFLLKHQSYGLKNKV